MTAPRLLPDDVFVAPACITQKPTIAITCRNGVLKVPVSTWGAAVSWRDQIAAVVRDHDVPATRPCARIVAILVLTNRVGMLENGKIRPVREGEHDLQDRSGGTDPGASGD